MLCYCYFSLLFKQCLTRRPEIYHVDRQADLELMVYLPQSGYASKNDLKQSVSLEFNVLLTFIRVSPSFPPSLLFFFKFYMGGGKCQIQLTVPPGMCSNTELNPTITDTYHWDTQCLEGIGRARL